MAGRAYVKIPDPQEGPLQARPSGLSFEGRNSFSLLLGCEIRFLDDVGNLWVAKFDQLDKCWVFFTPARLWGSADYDQKLAWTRALDNVIVLCHSTCMYYGLIPCMY